MPLINLCEANFLLFQKILDDYIWKTPAAAAIITIIGDWSYSVALSWKKQCLIAVAVYYHLFVRY